MEDLVDPVSFELLTNPMSGPTGKTHQKAILQQLGETEGFSENASLAKLVQDVQAEEGSPTPFWVVNSLPTEMQSAALAFSRPALQLVAIGDVGVGKSAFLQRLVGFPVFPTAQGESLCSTTVVRVCLRRGDSCVPKIQRFCRGVEVVADRREDSVPNIAAIIEAWMETNQPKICVNDTDEIMVTLQNPGLPNIDVVDLPGLVFAPGDGDEDDLDQKTKAIALKYIKQVERRATAFLVIIDTANTRSSPTIAMVREHKLQHLAIGVTTKVDTNPSVLTLDAHKTRMNACAYKFGWTYVCSSCVPTTSLARKLDLQHRNELDFLAKFPDVCEQGLAGVAQARAAVLNVYETWLSASWPELENEQLKQASASVLALTDELGLPHTDPLDQRTEYVVTAARLKSCVQARSAVLFADENLAHLWPRVDEVLHSQLAPVFATLRFDRFTCAGVDARSLSDECTALTQRVNETILCQTIVNCAIELIADYVALDRSTLKLGRFPNVIECVKKNLVRLAEQQFPVLVQNVGEFLAKWTNPIEISKRLAFGEHVNSKSITLALSCIFHHIILLPFFCLMSAGFEMPDSAVENDASAAERHRLLVSCKEVVQTRTLVDSILQRCPKDGNSFGSVVWQEQPIEEPGDLHQKPESSAQRKSHQTMHQAVASQVPIGQWGVADVVACLTAQGMGKAVTHWFEENEVTGSDLDKLKPSDMEESGLSQDDIQKVMACVRYLVGPALTSPSAEQCTQDAATTTPTQNKGTGTVDQCSVDELSQFLRQHNVDETIVQTLAENEINGSQFVCLSDDDLQDMGLSDAKERIVKAIEVANGTKQAATSQTVSNSSGPMIPNVATYSTDQLAIFLRQHNVDEVIVQTLAENEINGSQFVCLSDDDLQDMGMSHAKSVIASFVERLQLPTPTLPTAKTIAAETLATPTATAVPITTPLPPKGSESSELPQMRQLSYQRHFVFVMSARLASSLATYWEHFNKDNSKDPRKDVYSVVAPFGSPVVIVDKKNISDPPPHSENPPKEAQAVAITPAVKIATQLIDSGRSDGTEVILMFDNDISDVEVAAQALQILRVKVTLFRVGKLPESKTLRKLGKSSVVQPAVVQQSEKPSGLRNLLPLVGKTAAPAEV